jgi:mRNA interferase MazF
MLIIQSDDFNRSRIRTIVVVVLTTNLRLADAPGNILVTTEETQLSRDSVINVSQVITIDKSFLTERVGQVSDRVMLLIEDGIRLVLAI